MKNITKIIIFLVLISGYAYGQSTFSSERLSEAVKEYSKASINEDAEITILSTIEEIAFEQSGVEAEFSSDTLTKGRATVNVDFMLDSANLKSLTVPIQINIFKEISIAKSAIKAGNMIDARNLVFKRVDITNYNIDDILDATKVIGKAPTSDIPAGRPFLKEYFQPVKSIGRGDRVEIRAISGAVQIRTSGTALNDAVAGEEIRVRRDKSSTILTGILADDGSVIISNGTYFGSK